MPRLLEIDGYTIEKEIGTGAMATVYLAEQTSLSRQVALKVMSPSLASNDTFAKRFIQEGKTIAKLEQNNIVNIFDIGTSETCCYIAMEYLSGGTLKDRMQHPMYLNEALHIVRQIALALSYAHRHHFVHRDIKPLNVMYRADGTVVLTDFGIAKEIAAATSGLTATGAAIGTPTYMSPEQAKGEELDGRSDLYCLGVVFYELLTGVRPYTASDPFALALQHINAAIPKLPERLSFMQDMINKMMAKSAAKRFQDAEQLVAAIDRILEQYDTGKIRVLLNDSISNDQTQVWYKTLMTDWRSQFAKQRFPHQIRKIVRRKRMPLIVATTVLVLIFSVTLLYLGHLDRAEQQRIAQRNQTLERLLDDGLRQLSRAQIFFPKDDNAFDTYLEIRRLDPENERVLQPIATLLDRIHTLALRTYENADWNRTLALTDNGLRLDASNERLLGLQRSAHEAQERSHQQKLEREREAKITGLLTQADQQINAGRLEEPADDNAVATLRGLQELSPEDPRVETRMQLLAKTYAQQARQALDQGELDEAQARINLGLAMVDRFPALISLQQSLIDLRRQRQIDILLSEAQLLAAQQHFVQPADDSAWQRYRAVLDLDPDNPVALRGISALLEQIVALADAARRSGDYTAALGLVDQGMAIDAQSPPLLALHQQTARDHRIDSLLAAANTQLEQRRLNKTPGDNAVESFRQVLALQADQPQALAGLQQIADLFASRAEALLRQDDESASHALIEEGLTVLADHPPLLSVKDRLEAQIQARQQQQREIIRLLGEGESLSAQQQFSEPLDHSAHARYQAVLALDPLNATARQALKALPEQILALAKTAGEQGELEHGLDLLQQGLTLAPDNEALQAARRRVLEQQQIHHLLALAESQIKLRRLSKPSNDNAVVTLRQVLEHAPAQPQALDGLQRIAGIYAQLAREQLDQDRETEALALLQKGQIVSPNHPALLVIQRQVEQRRVIDRLLYQAEQQLLQGKFSRPPGDNGQASYRAILELDPINEAASAGLASLPEAIHSRAQQRLKDDAINEALALVAEGLELAPKHPPLQDLKLQLLLQQRISRLLQQAQQQLNSRQINQPDDESFIQATVAIYQQVLTLSPDNPQALAALQRLADEQVTQAKHLSEQGDEDGSWQRIRAGLAIKADHPGLLALQLTLTERQQAREAEALKQQQLQTLLAQARSELQRGSMASSVAFIERGLKLAPQQPELLDLRQQVARQQRILALLEQAEQQIHNQQLTLPANRNALATLQQVLELEPEHPQALAGIKWVADSYAELARERLQNNQEPQSLKLIDKGLSVVADHPPLLALRQQLEQRRQARETLQRQHLQIKQLLSQAQSQITRGQIITPVENSAQSSYREILQLDPANNWALSGLATLPDVIHDQVLSTLNAGALKDGLQRVDEGLQLEPQHPRLRALKAQLLRQLQALLTEARSERQKGALDNSNKLIQQGLRIDPQQSDLLQLQRQVTHQQQIVSLLNEAKQQIKRRQLTLPANDNAVATLSRLLTLAQDHPLALTGMQLVADAYAEQALAKIENGQDTEAQALIDQGLSVLPGHPPLLKLGEEIEARRAALTTRQRLISGLLALAEEQQRQHRYTNPRGNNAYESYRTILQFDAENGPAKNAIRGLSESLYDMASRAKDRGAIVESLALILEGLTILPNDQALLRLQQQLSEQPPPADTGGDLTPQGAAADDD